MCGSLQQKYNNVMETCDLLRKLLSPFKEDKANFVDIQTEDDTIFDEKSKNQK